MQIQNHALTEARCIAGAHCGAPIVPQLIVIHYTAGGSAESSVRYFLSQPQGISAHCVVDRDGAIYQLVPFNRKAYHAGQSKWGLLTNINTVSIGIELANWGCLDNSRRAWTGKALPEEAAAYAQHKHGQLSYWEKYPDAQIAACTEICRALKLAYPAIREIVGHDDIAPGRKLDPGPLFPMDGLRDELRNTQMPVTSGAGPCCPATVG